MLKGTKVPTTNKPEGRRLVGGLAAGVLLAASIGVGGLHAQEGNPGWLDWQKQDGSSDTTGSTASGVSAPGAVTTSELGGTGADTQSRLLQLEDQVRELTGRLDEMGHRLEQTNQQLQQLQQNIDFRLTKLEGGSAMNDSGAVTGPASTPAPSSGVLGTLPANADTAAVAPAAPAGASSSASMSLPEGTPEVQYEYARGLLKQGRYGEARAAFEEFLKVHPNDELSGNAQYWLGETYYAQGQYKNAADAFLNGYTTYKDSQKAPDSLLKLGMTMVVLGQKDAACSVFGELGNKFPNASPAIVARAQRERQKAGC